MDRLRVRPDAKQRLAESFETALRHADGRVIAARETRPALPEEGEAGPPARRNGSSISSPRSSPARCAATRCPELEPRLFSFNNPMGACPRCDGLGTVSFFDPKRVVAFPDLSLASGAIKGWDRRNQFYFQMLQSLAQHYGFDLEQPVRRAAAGGAGSHAARLRRGEDPVHLLGRARQVLRARARVRGRDSQPGAPLPGNGFHRRQGGAGQAPQHAALPRVRRHAAAARGAARHGGGPADLRALRADARPGDAVLRDDRADRHQAGDRGEDRAGDPGAARLSR